MHDPPNAAGAVEAELVEGPQYLIRLADVMQVDLADAVRKNPDERETISASCWMNIPFGGQLRREGHALVCRRGPRDRPAGERMGNHDCRTGAFW